MREIEQFNMKVSGFGTPRWRSAAGISQNAATAPFNLGGRPRYHNYQQHEHAITILFSLDIITMVILIEYKRHPMEMPFVLSTTRMRGSEIYLRPTAFRLDKYKELAAQHRPSTTQHNTNNTTQHRPSFKYKRCSRSSPAYAVYFLTWVWGSLTGFLPFLVTKRCQDVQMILTFEMIVTLTLVVERLSVFPRLEFLSDEEHNWSHDERLLIRWWWWWWCERCWLTSTCQSTLLCDISGQAYPGQKSSKVDIYEAIVRLNKMSLVCIWTQPMPLILRHCTMAQAMKLRIFKFLKSVQN